MFKVSISLLIKENVSFEVSLKKYKLKLDENKQTFRHKNFVYKRLKIDKFQNLKLDIF